MEQKTNPRTQSDADEEYHNNDTISRAIDYSNNSGRSTFEKFPPDENNSNAESHLQQSKNVDCDSECVYDDEYEYIDVVWLKRDIRWTDHGPLSEVAALRGNGASMFNPRKKQEQERLRKFVILYLYEPDQLKEPTVHGSHVRFIHEGLIDMDRKLVEASTKSKAMSVTDCEHDRTISSSFEYLTVCHETIISTLTSIHFRYLASSTTHEGKSQKTIVKRKFYKIARLLAHEETGHWQSYMRDRSVRKWCKTRSIPFIELNQTGVTRRLKDRDDYLKHWKAFIAKPLYPKPDLKNCSEGSFRGRLIQLDRLPGFLSCRGGIANIFDANEDDKNDILNELPVSHRSDRSGRQQFGGEAKAMSTLQSFLSDRGAKYSQGISSPNSSWNSCSRLSPYLTWGHISLRYVLKLLEERRENLREQKSKGRHTGTWLKSLQAFSSRAHWRSHFIQKLESEPIMEKMDLCQAYQHLRRQEGDWDQAKYVAWETGTTGYPFVDACMRCLIEHGWINFRMRAMLVSFATYNLWLDWKKIAPHLARVFLDYEPGIHYPQLQMQAGTTGINAMRVYNVTKQGKDQDPKGIFIRRYIPELRKVPDQYIHEPWKMSKALKRKYYHDKASFPKPSFANDSDGVGSDESTSYPEPIVDEKESAKVAKAKLNAVKKEVATRMQANQVFIKHGSRSRQSNEMNFRISGSGALPAAVAAFTKGRKELTSHQPKIKDAFVAAAAAAAAATVVSETQKKKDVEHKSDVDPTIKLDYNSPKRPPYCLDLTDETVLTTSSATPNKRSKILSTGKPQIIAAHDSIVAALRQKSTTSKKTISNPDDEKQPVDQFTSNLCTNVFHSKEGTVKGSWSCTACTFLNEKPHGLVCTICGTPR